MADRITHLPHLPVPAFTQRQPEPGRRHVLPEPDRNRPWTDRRIRVKELRFGRQRPLPLDDHAGAQLRERILARDALDLDEIGPRVAKLRFEK